MCPYPIGRRGERLDKKRGGRREDSLPGPLDPAPIAPRALGPCDFLAGVAQCFAKSILEPSPARPIPCGSPSSQSRSARRWQREALLGCGSSWRTLSPARLASIRHNPRRPYATAAFRCTKSRPSPRTANAKEKSEAGPEPSGGVSMSGPPIRIVPVFRPHEWVAGKASVCISSISNLLPVDRKSSQTSIFLLSFFAVSPRPEAQLLLDSLESPSLWHTGCIKYRAIKYSRLSFFHSI